MKETIFIVESALKFEFLLGKCTSKNNRTPTCFFILIVIYLFLLFTVCARGPKDMTQASGA